MSVRRAWFSPMRTSPALRYCFASVGFLYPIFMTLTALEGDRLEEAENDEYDAGDGENADAKAKKEQEEEIEKWAR